MLAYAGNIRVFCRCRPLSQVEVAANAASVIEFEAASNGDIVVRNGTAGKKMFKFDRVFSPQDDQSKPLFVSPCVASSTGSVDELAIGCLLPEGLAGTIMPVDGQMWSLMTDTQPWLRRRVCRHSTGGGLGP